MPEILYDTPIELTLEQYKKVLSSLPRGTYAHRTDGGKYYVKLWSMSQKQKLQQILK